MSDLPSGAKIPVLFKPGQPLTANDLNEMQKALLLLLYTHDHTGNEQSAPQGVPIGSEAIAPNAVKGQHISVNAVAKGDIHNGAVGASEIAEKCIASNHLVDGAVGTAQIKEKAVTIAKLDDEVIALLKVPREGATTYVYAAYLDGAIAYPTHGGRWFNWLLDATSPVPLHDLPIRRLRDDGGWQPIRSIMPPEAIRPIRPHVDLTTRAEMATSLASIFKQNEPVVRAVVGRPIAEVRAEGSQWRVTLEGGEKLLLADGDVTGLLGRLGQAGADLGKMANPLRSASNLTLAHAFERLAPTEGASLRMVAQSQGALPAAAKPMATFSPAFKGPIDPQTFLDPNPSDDLQERTRTAMLVDPRKVGWQIGQEGATYFQPGVGGNAAFTDNGQSITFEPNRRPSKEEEAVITRILTHFGIEDDERLQIDRLLSNPKVYDLLNNPQLLAAGFWTGASRNIRSVVRQKQGNQEFVRVRFATPYTDASYVVGVTPDVPAAVTHLAPITAHVLRRRADFVDLVFLQNSETVSKLSFSLTIHGELVQP